MPNTPIPTRRLPATMKNARAHRLLEGTGGEAANSRFSSAVASCMAASVWQIRRVGFTASAKANKGFAGGCYQVTRRSLESLKT